MTDKKREAFEKWYMTNTFAHVDHLSVFYNDLNCYSTPIANHCWKAWQAAQSAAVPVVGDVVAYEAVNCGGTKSLVRASLLERDPTLRNPDAEYIPLYKSTTVVISDAELDALRKCKAALLALKEDCQTSNDCQYGTISTSHIARIVDAAIAQGKGE